MCVSPPLPARSFLFHSVKSLPRITSHSSMSREIKGRGEGKAKVLRVTAECWDTGGPGGGEAWV